jgi:hypothetical protein
MMEKELEKRAFDYLTRRHFLRQCSTGMGMMALGSMLRACESSSESTNQDIVSKIS